MASPLFSSSNFTKHATLRPPAPALIVLLLPLPPRSIADEHKKGSIFNDFPPSAVSQTQLQKQRTREKETRAVQMKSDNQPLSFNLRGTKSPLYLPICVPTELSLNEKLDFLRTFPVCVLLFSRAYLHQRRVQKRFKGV